VWVKADKMIEVVRGQAPQSSWGWCFTPKGLIPSTLAQYQRETVVTFGEGVGNVWVEDDEVIQVVQGQDTVIELGPVFLPPKAQN